MGEEGAKEGGERVTGVCSPCPSVQRYQLQRRSGWTLHKRQGSFRLPRLGPGPCGDLH